ncbi:MAG TPA: hypothetical protein VGJ74_01070 [Burkholderiales bacterium]|jgi:hypothetical protein
MITLDTNTFIVLLIIAALGGALLGVLPAWLRLTGGAHALPVWGFMRRRELEVERHAAFQAELRCEMCDARPQCRRLLAEGIDLPAAGCPNAGLLERSA